MCEQRPGIETEITVRYSETDSMKIAHHSKYAVWFEIARTDFFRKIGFPYSEIENKGILLPLTDLQCKYRKPARYEDVLVIKTQVSRLSHVRIRFHYQIYHKAMGILLATGETCHGWTDRQLQPIRLAAQCPALYQALKSYCDQAPCSHSDSA